jgi:hypothetical protein
MGIQSPFRRSKRNINMGSTSEDEILSTKGPAPGICLDLILDIRLDEAATGRYHNELQVLNAWVDGLQFLYSQLRLLEEYARTRCMSEQSDYTAPQSPAGLVFGNLSCIFQWYAVTLCNFVELIGAIGWELDSSRKPPREYIKEVIPAVLAYRNKVGAHVGRARRNAANPAEQFLSLIPPSGLMNGRYMAGMWATHFRRSGNSNAGRLEPWSLTETHEKLGGRYWPDLVSSQP